MSYGVKYVLVFYLVCYGNKKINWNKLVVYLVFLCGFVVSGFIGVRLFSLCCRWN